MPASISDVLMPFEIENDYEFWATEAKYAESIGWFDHAEHCWLMARLAM